MRYTGQIIIKHAGSQLKTEIFECDGLLESVYDRFPESQDWKITSWSEPDEEGIERIKLYQTNPSLDEAPFAIQFSRCPRCP